MTVWRRAIAGEIDVPHTGSNDGLRWLLRRLLPQVPRRDFLWRLMSIGFVVMLCAGCAGARITHVAAASARGPQPEVILVHVDAPPLLDAAKRQLAATVAAKLEADLVKKLQQAKVVAAPYVPGASHAHTAILHVAITEADAGNVVTRMIIGFGVGRAELRARAELLSGDRVDAASMTAFETASDSGHMPGLVVPGGVALASANIIPLAVGGGIRVATGFKDALDKPVHDTSIAIVRQLRNYYASAGWHWPEDPSV